LEVEPVNTNATCDHTFNTIGVVDAAAVVQALPLYQPNAGNNPDGDETSLLVASEQTIFIAPGPSNTSENISPPDECGLTHASTVNGVVEFAITY
jgi:hypothetical protein